MGEDSRPVTVVLQNGDGSAHRRRWLLFFGFGVRVRLPSCRHFQRIAGRPAARPKGAAQERQCSVVDSVRGVHPSGPPLPAECASHWCSWAALTASTSVRQYT